MNRDLKSVEKTASSECAGHNHNCIPPSDGPGGHVPDVLPTVLLSLDYQLDSLESSERDSIGWLMVTL